MTDKKVEDLAKAGLLDAAAFTQILEMDEDEEEREFSRSIVFDFFDQALTTFDKMDSALEKQDIPELKALGHFLKGSSATLGLVKVRDNCEDIQNLGADYNENTSTTAEKESILKKVSEIVQGAKTEFNVIEQELRKFYNDP